MSLPLLLLYHHNGAIPMTAATLPRNGKGSRRDRIVRIDPGEALKEKNERSRGASSSEKEECNHEERRRKARKLAFLRNKNKRDSNLYENEVILAPCRDGNAFNRSMHHSGQNGDPSFLGSGRDIDGPSRAGAASAPTTATPNVQCINAETQKSSATETPSTSNGGGDMLGYIFDSVQSILCEQSLGSGEALPPQPTVSPNSRRMIIESNRQQQQRGGYKYSQGGRNDDLQGGVQGLHVEGHSMVATPRGADDDGEETQPSLGPFMDDVCGTNLGNVKGERNIKLDRENSLLDVESQGATGSGDDTYPSTSDEDEEEDWTRIWQLRQKKRSLEERHQSQHGSYSDPNLMDNLALAIEEDDHSHGEESFASPVTVRKLERRQLGKKVVLVVSLFLLTCALCIFLYSFFHI